MHTLKVIFGGFLLLEYACFLGAGLAAQQRRGRHYNQIFLVLWLVATLVNMWLESVRPATPSRMRLQLLCSFLQSSDRCDCHLVEILHVLGWAS